MPYDGQLADKTSHSDILNNPDIKGFLSECEYLSPPSEEEALSLANKFQAVPDFSSSHMPNYVIAVDGSNYESSLDEHLPSTKIGYIKIGAVLIKLDDFGALKRGNFVDPFRVADLQKNNAPLTFIAPSANIKWKGNKTVRDSFRAFLDDQLISERTRFDKNNYLTSLRSTLFHLASLRPKEMHTGDPTKLKLHQCPACQKGPLTLEDIEEQQYCPHCNKEIYPSDCLRLWEEISDFQSNQVAISRLMLVLEHLIPIHYIRHLYQQPLLLSEGAFFIDGPLAIFGNAAWIHRSILIFLKQINVRLKRKYNQGPLLLIGLVKTGQIIDYLNFIDKYIPCNRMLPIDDEFRYKYILGGRDPASKTFGYETYYGQDFIYKTESGKSFVFLLPYPVDTKDEDGINFNDFKIDLNNYPELGRALRLIHHFESDLYRNAIVPVALAHKYTAISLQPGGHILDILTKTTLEGK
jgi:hypothetical protein